MRRCRVHTRVGVSVANLNASPVTAPLNATLVSSVWAANGSGNTLRSSIGDGSFAANPLAVTPAAQHHVLGSWYRGRRSQPKQTEGVVIHTIQATATTTAEVNADLPVATSVCEPGLGSSAGGVGLAAIANPTLAG